MTGLAQRTQRVAADLAHACEKVGFFYALNHGAPDDTIEQAFAASRRFHALPLEQKLALRLGDNNIGCLPIDASIQGASAVHKAIRPNQNESFFVTHDRGPDHPDTIAGKPLRGRNQWPPGLPGLRADMMAYFDALRAMRDRCSRPLPWRSVCPPITSRRISPTKPTPICVFCTIRRRIPLKTIRSVRRRIPTTAL